jgi:hypothetical protein
MYAALLGCWSTTHQVPQSPWSLTGPTDTVLLASNVCGAAASLSACSSAALRELEHRLPACLLQALTTDTPMAVRQASLLLYTFSRQVQDSGMMRRDARGVRATQCVMQ